MESIGTFPFGQPVEEIRQIAELGLSSAAWHNVHQKWIKECGSKVAKDLRSE